MPQSLRTEKFMSLKKTYRYFPVTLQPFWQKGTNIYINKKPKTIFRMCDKAQIQKWNLTLFDNVNEDISVLSNKK